jgi:hypothetical protein
MFEHCILSYVRLHHPAKVKVLVWCERIWCGAGNCCRQLSVGMTSNNRLVSVRGTLRILRMDSFHNPSRDFLMAGRLYIIQNTLSNTLSAKGFHVTLTFLQVNFRIMLSMQVFLMLSLISLKFSNEKLFSYI